MFSNLSEEQNDLAQQALRDFIVILLCDDPMLFACFYRSPVSVVSYIALNCREIWGDFLPSDEELSLSLTEMEKIALDVKTKYAEKKVESFNVAKNFKSNLAKKINHPKTKEQINLGVRKSGAF